MTLSKLIASLETFDDDHATGAVEALIAAGGPAVEPLCGLLTVQEMLRRGNFSNSERLHHILKALTGLADPRAWQPALELFVALDEHARTHPDWVEVEGGNPNYNGSLLALYSFARRIDPARSQPLPALDRFEEFVAARARVRDEVVAALARA